MLGRHLGMSHKAWCLGRHSLTNVSTSEEGLLAVDSAPPGSSWLPCSTQSLPVTAQGKASLTDAFALPHRPGSIFTALVPMPGSEQTPAGTPGTL